MLALRRTLLLSGLLAVAGLTTQAQAATMIAGSQSLGLNANSGLTITPSGAALGGVTQFTLNMVSSTGGTSQTGGFIGVSSSTINAATIDTTNLNSFNFGSTAFGTFSASSGVKIVGPNPDLLAFYFLGTFTPGTDPGYGSNTLASPASFLVSFTQVGGAGNAISFSGTLVAPPAPLIPEPASLTMAAIPAALMGLAALRKRRKATA